MSLPGKVPTDSQPVEYSPMPVKKMRIFTDMERKELKQIIHEALDERVHRHDHSSDEWLYRGTY